MPINWDLIRLEKHFRGKSIAEIGVLALVAFLEKRWPISKTFNNQRGVFGTFFKFRFHRELVTETRS